MTDLNKLREEFEQLPVIAHGLKHRQFYFDDQDDCYTPTSSSHYHDAVYANGALDAYQEQQAKIDALKAQLDKLESGDYVLVPKEPTEEQWGGFARDIAKYMQMQNRYCPKSLKNYLDRYVGEIPEWLNEEVKNWDSEYAFATADWPAFIYKAMVTAAQEQNNDGEVA